MGLFSSSSPFDSCVERTTSEKNTSDDWSQIMDVCDKVKENVSGPKDCLKSITKRLNHDNPRVALQAITLLDACINNCGRKFVLEVAGREFEQELQKFITSTRTHAKVAAKLRETLKKWAEGEFKGDSELSLIPALYLKLQKEGHEFDLPSDSPKKTVKYSSDPNVVQSAEEEEDIAKAIQLSLQESASGGPKSGFQGFGAPRNPSSGLYSSASAVLASEASTGAGAVEKEPLKVRALYDFEAAEDNELTFKAGEIIIVLDNSDSNWWKGTNHKGEGLFPANFVTTELDVEKNRYVSDPTSGKRVSFSECVEVSEVTEGPADLSDEVTGEVDEDKIDQLLHLLHEADPTGERGDDPSVPILEEQVNAMAPTIDAELEYIDKKHAQLARISTDLVGALNLYHQLMRDMPSPMPYYSSYNKMMPNSGPQGMVPPPHYMPPNHQGMPGHPQMYAPNQYPPYGVPPVGGMPQYLPPHMAQQGGPVPPGHLGSPGSQAGPAQPPNYQQAPQGSHGVNNAMPNFNQFNHGAPQEFGAMASESGQNNMAPPPSPAPYNTQAPSTNHPPHAFPQNAPPQGLGMPPSSQGGVGNGHPQGPVMSMPHQGPPTSMPHQGPPTSMPHQGPPTSMPPQGPPTSMPSHGPPANLHHQGHHSSMPHQGPPVSMPHPGLPPSMPPTSMPPTSMPFYNQAPLPQMNQPLL